MTVQPKTAEDLERVLNNAASYFAKKGNINGKRLTTSQASTMSKVLHKYITDEEFDYAAVLSDLTDGWEDSSIIVDICENCDFLTDSAAEEKAQICSLIENLFSSAGIINENDDETPFMIVDWNININIADINAERKYFSDQVGQQTFREKGDQAFLKFVAIGKKHNLNLVGLMYDAYSKYRMQELFSLKAIDNTQKINITGNQFLAQSKYVKNIQSQSSNLQFPDLISSYENRLNPKLNIMNRTTLIDDDCNIFINYTLMMASVINQILKKNECCPLQVDLVIIPKKIVNNNATMVSVLSSDGESSSDDDDDDDYDGDNDSKTDDIVSDLLPMDVERVFSELLPNALTSNISTKTAIARTTRAITAHIVEILNTVDKKSGDNKNIASSHKRIEVVIDRRFEPNKVYVYTLPDELHEIKHDFCEETLIVAASKNIIPKSGVNDLKGKTYIGGSFDCDGHMFCVSFQAMQMDKIRLQWYYNGGSIRMWPEYMINLWPMFFVNSVDDENKNAGGNGNKYSLEYIEKEFALDLRDDLFDSWYKVLKLKKMVKTVCQK